MRPFVIVSGVLGGGSALVFAAAAVVASLFPTGALVPTQGWTDGRFIRAMPAVRGPLIFDDNAGGGWEQAPIVLPERGPGEPEIDVVMPPPDVVVR